MRVLLVEDDQSVADGLLDGLSGANFETLHVMTGADALSSVNEFNPDIVLLDLGLPDMDGTDVCRQIRAFSHVPIIVASARETEMDRVDVLEIGADDYITKPVSARILALRTSTQLRHRALRTVTSGNTITAGPLPSASMTAAISFEQSCRSA